MNVHVDDLAIFAKIEEEMQYNINKWNHELQKYNMIINVEKTKVMAISKEEKTVKIALHGKEIEQIDNFTYLGSKINCRGNPKEKVNQRLIAASKNVHALNKTILNHKDIARKTKMKLYKTIYRLTLTYGSESWVLSQ